MRATLEYTCGSMWALCWVKREEMNFLGFEPAFWSSKTLPMHASWFLAGSVQISHTVFVVSFCRSHAFLFWLLSRENSDLESKTSYRMRSIPRFLSWMNNLILMNFFSEISNSKLIPISSKEEKNKTHFLDQNVKSSWKLKKHCEYVRD